jgi:wobble nucleotide-excising tRNase
MLNKITQIVSVSRFKNFASTDDKLSFSSANLIFAPNGRGKTSVSDIIQSFLRGEPALMNARTSRVYPGNTEVTLTYNTPTVTARYTNNNWSNPISGVACLVFDKAFIQQNIHTISVEHDHKKKLHGLIVGESAVEARRVVKEKRDELTEAQKIQRSTAQTFAVLGTKNLTADSFVKMVSGDTVALNTEKTLLAKQLEALGNPETVKLKPSLMSLSSFALNAEALSSACSGVVDGGSKEAIELIKQHSAAHVHGDGNESKVFLAASVKALGTKDASSCALCGQTIGDDARQLVEALFTIFNAKYLSLRKEVASCITMLNTLDISAAFSQVANSVELNQARYEEWAKFIENLAAPQPVNHAALNRKISEAKPQLLAALVAKADDLSKVIVEELKEFMDSCKEANDEIKAYNQRVAEVNAAIQKYKDAIDISKKQVITARIATIDNIVIRSSTQGGAFCASYATTTTQVNNADKAYKQALADFAKAQKGIIEKHGDIINGVLEYCGAKFRLNGITQGTRSGSTEPYIEYSIKLNGGTHEAHATAAEAIGYILSDGEKNLLAFAFFWSLIQYANPQTTIAIFDDPLTSIDQAWRLQLIDKLKELCDKGLLQLFVLTHYEDFGRVVALRIAGIKQITIEGGGATLGNKLAPYDIEAVSKELQFARIEKLRDYINNPNVGEPKDIQVEIRTVLEAALKYKYYLKLSPLIDGKKWLRDFITEPSVKPLLVANGSYATLDTLCTTGGWANHASPPSQIFDQDQATAYAQQTLDILEKL